MFHDGGMCSKETSNARRSPGPSGGLAEVNAIRDSRRAIWFMSSSNSTVSSISRSETLAGVNQVALESGDFLIQQNSPPGLTLGLQLQSWRHMPALPGQKEGEPVVCRHGKATDGPATHKSCQHDDYCRRRNHQRKIKGPRADGGSREFLFEAARASVQSRTCLSDSHVNSKQLVIRANGRGWSRCASASGRRAARIRDCTAAIRKERARTPRSRVPGRRWQSRLAHLRRRGCPMDPGFSR